MFQVGLVVMRLCRFLLYEEISRSYEAWPLGRLERQECIAWHRVALAALFVGTVELHCYCEGRLTPATVYLKETSSGIRAIPDVARAHSSVHGNVQI